MSDAFYLEHHAVGDIWSVVWGKKDPEHDNRWVEYVQFAIEKCDTAQEYYMVEEHEFRLNVYGFGRTADAWGDDWHLHNMPWVLV